MRAYGLAAIACLVAACGKDANPALSTPATEQAGLQEAVAKRLGAYRDYRVCDDRPFTPTPEGFAHRHHRVGGAVMSTRYVAQDVVVTPGEPASLRSSFYFHGTGGNGLNDERVDVFVDDCQDWQAVGSARTDENGEVNVALPEKVWGVGRYGVRHELKGDGTVSDSDLHVLPWGTQIVVLDMDGTLTLSNLEIWRKVYEDLHKRKYVPKPITGARDVVAAWAEKGFVPVYLTARPVWLAPSTREWRTSFLFPEGPIVFAQGAEARHAEAYKVAYLKSLAAAGFRLSYAYGNEDHDQRAYAAVGVPEEHTFIIGKGKFGGYEEHLAWVHEQPDADP